MVVGKVIRWHIAFALLVAVLLDGGVELSHGAYLRTVVYPTTAYYPTSLVENDDDGGGLPLGFAKRDASSDPTTADGQMQWRNPMIRFGKRSGAPAAVTHSSVLENGVFNELGPTNNNKRSSSQPQPFVRFGRSSADSFDEELDGTKRNQPQPFVRFGRFSGLPSSSRGGHHQAPTLSGSPAAMVPMLMLLSGPQGRYTGGMGRASPW